MRWMIALKDPKHHSHYERLGERTTHRIASVIAKKSWKWTIINLAWTVGPVTYIALQFGHYLGFGAEAPIANFIYFAGYTLMVGALAITASIVHEALHEPKIHSEQEQLLCTIDRLHNAMFSARNQILASLDANERNIMSAYYILQSVGASPSAIETAVMKLSHNEALTSAIRRAHVLAERGMFAAVEDIYHDHEEILQTYQQNLGLNAPQAYELLDQRLRGMSPTIQHGIERTDGFIERILNAYEENDERLMTMQDAYDMFTLAFELVNGRHIAVLDARLKGDESFEEAQEMLDEARHHYRMALRKRNSAIRLLVKDLYEHSDSSVLVEATDATSRLLIAISEALASLGVKERARYKVPYLNITRLNKALEMRREKLLRAEARYARKWREHGEWLTLAMQSNDLKKAGFYISERSVALSDKQKLKLVHLINGLLPSSYEKWTEAEYAHAAMEIANELDDMVDMSQPEEQLAIESSNAADFGYITRKLAPTTKAGWASIAIDAIHENRRKASHRLAHSLLVFYRVPLTDSMIALFEDQFGADRDYLESLNEEVISAENVSKMAIPAPPPRFPGWSELNREDTKKQSA